MKREPERRNPKNRRDSSDQRSEKFVEYFIPPEKEKRSGEDRRKPSPDDK